MELSIASVVEKTTKAKSDEFSTSLAVSAADEKRFSDLLSADLLGGDLNRREPSAPTSASAPASIGDRILNGLTSLSGDFERSWSSISSASNGENALSAHEILKLQMNFMQMFVKYELVNKAITRSVQNVEQLVKIQ